MATFEGYGGSSVEMETKCYTYRGVEVRIPRRPEVFSPDEVAEEYACFSGLTLESACIEIDDLAEEFPDAFA